MISTDTLTGNLIDTPPTTYLERKLPCVNHDDLAAELEACVSIGEFDGLVLTITCKEYKTLETVQLDLEQARNLREVLNAAIDMLAAAEPVNDR